MSATEHQGPRSPLAGCPNPDTHPHLDEDGTPMFAKLNQFAAKNIIAGSVIYLPVPQPSISRDDLQTWVERWANLANQAMGTMMRDGDDAFHACDCEIHRSLEQTCYIRHEGRSITAVPILFCVGNPSNEWRVLSTLGFEAITGLQAQHYFDLASYRNRNHAPGPGTVSSDGGLLEKFMDDMCGSELFKSHEGVPLERIVNRVSFVLEGGGGLINPQAIVIREIWRIGDQASEAYN